MKFGAGYATTLPPSALHRLGSPQAADAAPAGDTGILGIPHDELTPKVRAALSALVDEVHRLRQDLAELQPRAVPRKEDGPLGQEGCGTARIWRSRFRYKIH